MTLVVRISSETEGPNRLPGKSKLTLFRSKTGMSSVACLAGRLSDHDGGWGPVARGAVARGTVARGTVARGAVAWGTVARGTVARRLDEVPCCYG